MSKETNLPSGIFVRGQILSSEKKSGTSKAGNAYTMLSYMVMCGRKIVKVDQIDAETAPVHPEDTTVEIEIKPSFRDNGVILLSGNVVAA